MSSERNKAIVTELWKHLAAGDSAAALALCADDIRWWISGTLDGVSGTKRGKAEMQAFLEGVRAAFPGGLQPAVERLYADGDTVVAELVNRGTSVTGKAYENEYCFVFELEGGRIRAIREYVDLAKARAALSEG